MALPVRADCLPATALACASAGRLRRDIFRYNYIFIRLLAMTSFFRIQYPASSIQYDNNQQLISFYSVLFMV
jgi:hypothetical protein